jgi:hypothetical protein
MMRVLLRLHDRFLVWSVLLTREVAERYTRA